MLKELSAFIHREAAWQRRHGELISPEMISLVLGLSGLLSLLLALAGEVGWLQETRGHYYALLGTALIQLTSAAAARLWPKRAMTLFAANLLIYAFMLILIVHFIPDQPQFLFAGFFPIMAAFLIVSTPLGILLTLIMLAAPVMLSMTAQHFLISYMLFMTLGAIISYWLGTQLRRLLENMHRMVNRLEHLATHDPLTGAYNRRGVKEHGETLMALHRRTISPLTLALIDLDYFKQVNDTYGHEAGDAALKGVVKALQAAFRRRSDIVGRLGGDELILILPETPLETACEKLTAFARHLQRHRPRYHDVELPIALSIGVVRLEPEIHHDLNDLIHAADQQVYRAKAAGRSHICCQDGGCAPIELGFTPPQYR